MSGDEWRFWIDVGGTFTDCVARSADGELLRWKTLSSGVVKGTVSAGSNQTRIVDPLRQHDPPDFWRGWKLRICDPTGQTVDETHVERFDSSRSVMQLASPLSELPQEGHTYELHCGLEAPTIAIRYLLQLPLDLPLPACEVRLGTTRGTNALLTRQGAATAFVTTKGFADVLSIGYQSRPKLFERTIRKSPPLYESVLEIAERISADGDVVSLPDAATIRSGLLALRDRGIQSLAICLLNAYANPIHEQLVAQLAREVGFRELSLSSEVAPLMKIVSRGDTTVLDAYLNPVLSEYLSSIAAQTSSANPVSLRIMTSAGGLTDVASFRGKDSILSGPAGGCVGMSRVAEAAGFRRAIGFDMGGTSTDVARYDGRLAYEYETEKAGVRVVTPTLSIETVAAGGGSICRFDGVRLLVGPQSAGATPGPACYGNGGPLTVTDVNLFLGRVLADHFPFHLQQAAVEQRLASLLDEVNSQSPHPLTAHELAAGFLQVANANMAQAIRSISIARGYDVRDDCLVAYGGAAAQHACAVARELQIKTILHHPCASVLSALGVGLADVTQHAVRAVYSPLDETLLAALESHFCDAESEASGHLAAQGWASPAIETHRAVELRYLGTNQSLTVDWSGPSAVRSSFETAHRRLYGYIHQGRELEVVAVRVEARSRSANQLPLSFDSLTRTPSASFQRDVWFEGAVYATDCYDRERLQPGDELAGPALVMESQTTIVVEPGWKARVLSEGEILLTDVGVQRHETVSTEYDPITLEIFNRHFESIAQQMGLTLQNTSSSVNVKERLDFSCAVFTRTGDLVVNAPHIPVHLGAMSETVRRILADFPDLAPDDVVVTNDPYRGGSHLPDITVVTPVFDGNGELRMVVASRAHHAEIGGITPGSMPPFSTRLAEEGVLIPPMKIVERGESQLERLSQLLSNAPYPSRDVAANLADVTAQIAANRQGQQDLQTLIERFGWDVVSAYMQHIQDAAELKTRRALRQLPDQVTSFEDHLDDGTRIRVTIDKTDDLVSIDFTGTSPTHAGNLNANTAIVRAAVMYTLRCLIDEPIPLNEGVLAPVELVVPRGLLNPEPGATADESPAVVGGNVETSQRIVDVLFGAFGLAAASQGTMNNVLFGDQGFGYYETICGGSGATSDGDGADAVHTHMTNTRLTDPEVLERRYPVQVDSFCIRRGSGGAGKHRGGNGVERRLRFLAPLQLSILSQRRGDDPPYGMNGGEPGAVGENWLQHADGHLERLPGSVQRTVEPGDVLIIKTPGGGGYGTQINPA